MSIDEPGDGVPPLSWRKSSRCDSAACVEVAFVGGGGVAVRNSTTVGGAVLTFERDEWSSFVAGVRAGDFDD
ncbi:MAG TPA: DUF397 domain-containing protein [Micromonosporaceae bacterium]|nr:DUF397 domain-containing protein [Micromonosporaceae bacterium]